jgi:hypothetical protein
MMKGVCKNKLNFWLNFEIKQKLTMNRIFLDLVGEFVKWLRKKGKLSYNSRDYHFPIENP